MRILPHNALVEDLEPIPSPFAEMGMLDLVLHRVKFRAQRRRLWIRELLNRDGEDGNASANYHILIENILLGKDNVVDEITWQSMDETVAPYNAALAEVEDRLRMDQSSRLAGLVINFGLTDVEVMVLHACLAIAMEPAMERVCSYLQDHNGRGYVTMPLVTKLFCLERSLNGSELHALKIWGFVREVAGSKGEPALYEIDSWTFNWLRGQNTLDPVLIGRAQFPALPVPVENWPLEEAAESITRIIGHNPVQKLRLCIQGIDGSGRQTFAAHVAERFGLPLLVIDTDHAGAAEWEELYLHAQRQAYLSGFALAWRGDDLSERHWPKEVLPVQLQFAILAPEQVLQPQAQVVDLKLSMKPLTIPIRRQLWQSLVPMSAEWAPEVVDHLVIRYPTTVGQIATVGMRAASNVHEAIEILREAGRHKLGKLAQMLPSSFTWDDLTLHPTLMESLQDFVYEAQEREQWWEGTPVKRLFPQGKGLMALFSGPSGTGKTMTAQVIAAALELDLFRIDLSNVISKYVGETSKHIDKILRQAQTMHAVLLFDEADTLFGKRTEIKDAHDRFANADTNYLLQAIESYPGVAILATNRKANIDPAFLRRLRFSFEFSKPDTAQRLQMWQNLLHEMVGGQGMRMMTEPLRQIASMVELTGAQIKYAVLAAVFVARREGKPLGVTHLLKGIDRELAKEGKGLSPETAKRLEVFKR